MKTFLILFQLIILFSSTNSFAQDPPGGVREYCHQLEGSRLRGCSPQSKPADCGPPKPCPPCVAALECRTMVVGVTGGGGICVSWNPPVCTGPPENQTCSDPTCREHTVPRCVNHNIPCYREKIEIPSVGTYSCSYIECRCDGVLPPGYVWCEKAQLCQDDRPCAP